MSIILKVCFWGHCVPSWYQGKHPVQSLRTLCSLGRIKGRSFSSMKYVICLKSLASFWWSCFSEPSVVLSLLLRKGLWGECVCADGASCHWRWLATKWGVTLLIASFLPAFWQGLMLHMLCVLSFLSLLFLSDNYPMRKSILVPFILQRASLSG